MIQAEKENLESANKENIYMCLILLKLANDRGIGPDIWFSSTCILFKLDKLPSSSGKEPFIWFPLRSLKTKKGNYSKNAQVRINYVKKQNFIKL